MPHQPESGGVDVTTPETLNRVARSLPVWDPLPPDSAYVELTHPDGARIRITADALIGRQPGEHAGEEDVIGVPVQDPHKSVSRVHAKLWVTPSAPPSVSDAGSGNGTLVQRGEDYISVEEKPEPLEDGDIIWLGDVGLRTTLQH